LLGSIHCAATLRVKDFLTRNGHPYTFIDLDREADVQLPMMTFYYEASRRKHPPTSETIIETCNWHPPTRSPR